MWQSEFVLIPVEIEKVEVIKVGEPVKIALSQPDYLSSCVLYLIHKGVKIPPVSAIWFTGWKLTKTPTLGSIVVIKYGEGELQHHVGQVIEFGATAFLMDSANLIPDKQSYDWIDYTDERIQGYFIPPLEG